MEHRQHVEHLVARGRSRCARRLRAVRQHVAVGQHDALRRALRAGGEQDRRRSRRACARPAAARTRNRPRSLSPACRWSRGCLRDRRSGPRLRRAAASSWSSLPFSTKAREVRMVPTCAALQAARIFAAPAVKLIIAGTRPADISARQVTAAPLAFGSITPERPCPRRASGISLRAEHARRRSAALAVGERAGERVLDGDAAPCRALAPPRPAPRTPCGRSDVVRKTRSDMIS